MKNSSRIKILFLCGVFLFSLPLLSKETQDAPQKEVTQIKIPTGNWQYSVFIKGQRIGSAYTSTKIENGIIISTVEMVLKMGESVLTTKDIIKETTQFEPISKWHNQTVVLADKVTRTICEAVFDKNKVTVTHNKNVKEVTIDGKFYLSDVHFLAEAIKNKFEEDFTLEDLIYEPTIDDEKPIKITERITGKESVDISGKQMNLIHSVISMGPVKNIHNYIDSNGIVYKTSISVGDMTMDIILEKGSE